MVYAMVNKKRATAYLGQIVPSNICLGLTLALNHAANSLVATFAKCSPLALYFCT